MSLYREANYFNIKFIIETTITLILFERKHNMARSVKHYSKRTLATLVELVVLISMHAWWASSSITLQYNWGRSVYLRCMQCLALSEFVVVIEASVTSNTLTLPDWLHMCLLGESCYQGRLWHSHSRKEAHSNSLCMYRTSTRSSSSNIAQPGCYSCSRINEVQV